MLRGFDPNPHVAHRFMTSCDDPHGCHRFKSDDITGGHPHKDIDEGENVTDTDPSSDTWSI